MDPLPVPAVIAVVIHEDQVLLVRRANPPDAGLWGFPGGKIAFGESLEAAALRELREETGIVAEARSVMTALDVFEAGQERLHRHFILIPILCRWISGVALAGDDALEAGWFPIRELDPNKLSMSSRVDVIAREAARRWDTEIRS